jgi:autotransporter-associated beta strand protein
VQLTAADQIADTAAVSVVTTGTLNLNGFNEAIGALAGTGSVTLGTGTGTLTLGGDGSSQTFSGIISGTGSVAKMGGGTQILSGANSYTGGTTISAGTLTIAGSLASGAGTTTVANGATLRGDGNGTTTGVVRAVTVQAGGRVWPGTTTTTLEPKGKLTVTSASFNGGGILKIRGLKASPLATDQLVVTSSGTPLDLNGASLELALTSPPSMTDQATFLSLTGGGTFTYPFTNITVLNPSGTISGLTVNYYLGANPVPVYTQIMPANGILTNDTTTFAAADSVGISFSGVTPVTVDSFTARPEGAGVLVEWHCTSEYQNAGFHVWRREANSGNAPWTRINPQLIGGRLTSPEPKTYRLCDVAAPGRYEYRLESISTQGRSEFYHDLAGPVLVVEPADGLGSVTANGALSVLDRLMADVGQQRNDELGRAFAAKSGGDNAALPPAMAAHVKPIAAPEPRKSTAHADGSLGPAPAVAPVAAARSAQSAGLPAARRGLGAASRSVVTEAVKVVHQGSGVLVVPQAAMPAGYDVHSVAVTREGQPVTALAVTGDGLVLYAPGYEDEYTNKDAFFLMASPAPTAAGAVTGAQGLFADGATPITATQATVMRSFHDVYFDWGLRPYTMPPWFSSQYLTEGSTQAFTVETPKALASPGALTVLIWAFAREGATGAPHALQAYLNGTPLGEARWTGEGAALQITFPVPAGLLLDGANAVELRTPITTAAANQLSMLHSLVVNYTRTLSGPGAVELRTTSTATQLCEVNGLPNGRVWVVDLRDPAHPALAAYESQAQPDGSMKVRFQAAGGGQGKYLIAGTDAEIAPLAVTKRLLKPVPAAANYLAVGPAQFAAGIQPLITARNTGGLSAMFVDQEEVFDYYAFGRYGPSGIQAAVRAVQPKFLLLVGRSTYDYKNYGGVGVDTLCPTIMISTSFWSHAPADPLFGDLGRGYPEVSVGRLPVNTPEELAGAVAHTLGYKGLYESGWRGLLAADRLDPNAGDFAAEADGLAAANPQIAWGKSYLGVNAATSPDVTAAMEAAANGAADLMVYVGHGNAARLGAATPSILDVNTVQNWTGNVVMLGSTCTFNWFVKNEPNYHSIPIQGLTQPQGGIAASIASTTYTQSLPDTQFMAELLKQAATTAGARWGEALVKTQQVTRQKAGGQDGWEMDLVRTVCILGDPALPVYVTAPQQAGSGTGGGTTGGGQPPTGGGGNGGGGNGGGGNGGTPTAMAVNRLAGNVNFAADGRDAVGVIGALSGLPENLDTTGATVTLNVGGATREFTLDGRGRAKNGADSVRVTLKARNGLHTLRAVLKGAFADLWLDEGVKAEPATAPITMTVEVTFNGARYTASVPATYTSKTGKTGKFRK